MKSKLRIIENTIF